MKKLTLLMAALLVVALTVPAFAEGEDELSIKLTRLRNRLDFLIQTPDGATDDTQEFIEDDVDIRLKFAKGELEAELQFEASDGTFSSDVNNESSKDVNSWLEFYYFAWKPAALKDKNFRLRVGAWDDAFQTPNGHLWGIRTYPESSIGSYRGAIEATMTLGKADTRFEYRRI
jgi:hypothetical protein